MPRRAHDDADPARNALLEFLNYKLDDKSYLKAEEMLKAILDTSSTERTERPEPGAMDAKYAMDSSDAFTRMNDLRKAEQEVAATVGQILGMDSAAAVFREALSRMGTPYPNLPVSALPVMFRTVRRNQSASGGSYRPALDATASARFARENPDVARIRMGV